MKAHLVSVQQLTPYAYSFWFKPESHIDYTAGQFIELTLPHNQPDDRGIRRWFTLSSSPSEEQICITTLKAERPSSFMKTLFNLKPGAEVTMSQAMGDFVLPRDKTIPLLFVVGGIGITPVRSMLTYLSDNNESRSIIILYAAHRADEIIFKPLLDLPEYKTTYYLSNPAVGQPERLNTELIIDAINLLDRPLVYISGPEEMVEIIFDELKQKGVNPSRLVTDYFPGYGTN
jgi:ferredoxin-NADP reductase